MNSDCTNSLIKETSPYLLQHAHNPVNWLPWGNEAFDLAKKENKLMLVSIGYSSCHWCHVMEREVFSDLEVASIMNSHFICIKVDREERPDVDQIYMNAIQIITRSGGWPLNCFTLPNGHPVFGGTYFPKDSWIDILLGLNATWQSDPLRVVEVANELTLGIKKTEIVKVKEVPKSSGNQILVDYISNWGKYLDHKYGSTKGSPKFPMPGSLEFLLRYSSINQLEHLQKFVMNSLDQMLKGGIYDHLGGGFFRYSVDERWEVPHFEKMLYDNAQLMQLYSLAYSAYRNEEYKRIVSETAEFLMREMQSGDGGFYSAIDADSEGIEGAFYTWTPSEVESILGDDKNLFSIVYGVSAAGNHKGRSVLRRCAKVSEAACILMLDLDQAHKRLSEAKLKMLTFRGRRARPLTDDKIITSWNALLVSAFVTAYISLGNDEYLKRAIETVAFIENRLQVDNVLFRVYCKGITKINAFLDDYAFLIEAYVALYKATSDEAWLVKAKKWTAQALEKFYDSESGMFYYSDLQHDCLIVRKMELADGVIPSSTAVMAENLFSLGVYLHDTSYTDRSRQMVANMEKQLVLSGPYVFRWASVLHKITLPVARVAYGSAIPLGSIIRLLKECQFYTNFYPQPIKPDSMLKDSGFMVSEYGFQLCLGNTCLPPQASIEEVVAEIVKLK